MKIGDLVYVAMADKGELKFLAKGKIAEKVYIQEDSVVVNITRVFYKLGPYHKGIMSWNKVWVHAFPTECPGVIRQVFGRSK